MIIRFFIFLLIIYLAAVAPVWLFAGASLLYAVRYTAYELIVVSASIDAYYGLSSDLVPYYTLVTVCVLILIEWVKPRISLYNEGT